MAFKTTEQINAPTLTSVSAAPNAMLMPTAST
uniref:Orphan protein n=1 Tax=Macrostomum lignano TaxID=282301 RepID=A0A1I8J587_9PLAT